MAEIEKIQPMGDTAQYALKDIKAIRTYTRAEVGNAPNYDNPGFNGLFEIRGSSEVPDETGTKPYAGWYPCLTAKVEHVMLQIAGGGTSYYIRGKQGAGVTMADTAWNRIVLNSGTWDISISGNAATSSSCSGNAATATKLATARTINGTSFDGSANITTANWGTARTLTIGGTGKSVNGSENVSWSLSEIGAAAASHSHSYLPLSGGTMTGMTINTFGGNSTARHLTDLAFYENNASSYTGTIKIKLPHTTSNCVMQMFKIIVYDYNGNSGATVQVSGYTYSDKKWYNYAASVLGTFTKGIRLAHDGTNYCILLGTTSTTWNYSKVVLADIYSGYGTIPTSGYAISLITSESGYTVTASLSTHLRANAVYGAVWNDYAEMRKIPEAQIENAILKPGMCVKETGNGEMIKTEKRLERGCKVISDTFGFNIGETDDCKTPIAVSGRALVYIYEGRDEAASHIGWPVCSGPDGTVSIMIEEEEEKYPSRIVGIISEIPDYDTWGTGNVSVDGRIWIYVR